MVGRLKADGARVAGIDLDEPGLIRSGVDVVLVGDVTDETATQLACDNATTALGGLDALVCCAGVVRPGTVEDMSLADWKLQFDVNVWGTMLACRCAIPHLRAAGGGAIVTISSNLALVAEPGAAAYSASKSAIIGLSRAMALDHIADGIRVNTVCPGPTRTPMVQHFIDQADDPEEAELLTAATQVHGRLIEPREIAEAVAYLLSPAAGSTIGTVLTVDGGYTLR